MEKGEINERYKAKIRELESQISRLNYELDEARSSRLEEEKNRQFYQMVADFTFGWEIWFKSDGKIKYCSPSCYDLTGYTANQVITAPSLSALLIYSVDQEKFNNFLDQAVEQSIMNQSLEFRILTRHKQLRWCSMNVRGVYNKVGRYLGIRASIHDISRLKKAMGHIHDLTSSKELENRAKLKYKSVLDLKERELVSFLLQLSQKNELIALVKNKLKKIIEGDNKNLKLQLNELLERLQSDTEIQVNWDMVSLQLEKLHPGFMGRLQVRHPNLTAREKKLCAYLKLDLSSKEIAGLQNLNPKSVEIARVRLRKKLKLTRDIRLSAYLEQV
jgi:PAS domain S-box-containing protein